MLNLKIEHDRFPMPSHEDIFDKIEGCRYFTIMDMRHDVNQIQIRPENKEKTAFWASNCRWQWIVMPFGLKNAGADFQKVMDDALVHHPNAKCYIDDVLIYNTTFEQHLAHIRQAFDSIAAMDIKAPPDKVCLRRTRSFVP